MRWRNFKEEFEFYGDITVQKRNRPEDKEDAWDFFCDCFCIFSAQIQYVNKFNFSKFKLQLIFNRVVVVCRFHVFVEIFNDWRDKPFFCFETGFKKEKWKKKRFSKARNFPADLLSSKKPLLIGASGAKYFIQENSFAKTCDNKNAKKGKSSIYKKFFQIKLFQLLVCGSFIAKRIKI